MINLNKTTEEKNAESVYGNTDGTVSTGDTRSNISYPTTTASSTSSTILNEEDIRKDEREKMLSGIHTRVTSYCKNFYERNKGSQLTEEVMDGFLIRLYNYIRVTE